MALPCVYPVPHPVLTSIEDSCLLRGFTMITTLETREIGSVLFGLIGVRTCGRMCGRMCVRACVACVRACVRACVCTCACVCACVKDKNDIKMY